MIISEIIIPWWVAWGSLKIEIYNSLCPPKRFEAGKMMGNISGMDEISPLYK